MSRFIYESRPDLILNAYKNLLGNQGVVANSTIHAGERVGVEQVSLITPA